jgi:hypothetical protein
MMFFKKKRLLIKEIKNLKQENKELKYQVDSKKNIERYIFGSIELLDEDGNVFCEIDRWVSKSLIESAVETYVMGALARKVVDENFGSQQ